MDKASAEAIAKDTHYPNGQPIREVEVDYEDGQRIVKERISGGDWQMVSETPVDVVISN